MSHSGDLVIDAKAILKALSELKGRGNKAVMAEVESIEPELADHVCDQATANPRRTARLVPTALLFRLPKRNVPVIVS